MTPEERQELDAWSEELAEADRSPWEPAVVVRAFSAQPVRIGPWTLHPLTFAAWLALERTRNPFLVGRGSEDLEPLADAIGALAGDLVTPGDVMEELPLPEQALFAASVVQELIASAWTTAVNMQPPSGGSSGKGDDGFGLWLILLSRCITELGMSREEAFAAPVAQALALLATGLRNQGWRVAGPNYRQRATGAESAD